MIQNETNSYAERRKRMTPDPHWSPVSEEEIRAFLGIRIYMSVVVMPATDLYWSTDPAYGNSFIQKVCSCLLAFACTDHISYPTGHEAQ